MPVPTVSVRVPMEVYEKLTKTAAKYEVPIAHAWILIEEEYKRKIEELGARVKELEKEIKDAERALREVKKSGRKVKRAGKKTGAS